MPRLKHNSPKNKQCEMDERRMKVATLYIKGKTQWEIARDLDISQSVVSQDIAAVRDQWRASAIVDFDAKKEEELARLDHLERECWRAWEHSCENAEFHRRRVEESIRREKIENKNGPKNPTSDQRRQGRGKPNKGVGRGEEKEEIEEYETKLVPVRTVDEKTVQGRTGDPRFLDQVFRCIETRMKILGLFKDITQNNTFNQVVIPWDALFQRKPVEQLDEVDPIEAKILEVEKRAVPSDSSEGNIQPNPSEQEHDR